MHARYSTLLAFLFTIVSCTSALAQVGAATTRRPNTPERPWHVAVIGGAVSQAAGTPLLGAEVAERLGRHGQAYFAVTYLENLMRESLTDDLDSRAAQLNALTGDPWAFSARDRGVSVVGGGKYTFGDGGVRPYVGAGAGVINLKRTVVDVVQGDVTQAVFNDYALGEADLSLSTQGITKPLVEGAFGVEMGTGRIHFDVGLRVRRAFRLAEPLNFAQVGVGFGYRF
jgi:hypothetical protein